MKKTDGGAVQEAVTLPWGKMLYWSCGSGFPMLLVHGIGWGSWVWERVLEPLAEHYRIYAVDLPGFHGSDRPNDWYRIEDLGDGLVAFMDAVGIQQAHVVSQHGGAIISFDLAARHPERVAKLVLNSCPAWSREVGRTYHETQWLPRQCTKVGFMPPRTLERVSKMILGADQYAVDMWNKGDDDKGWMLIAHQAMGDYDAPPRVGNIQAPTMLLYGEKESAHLLACKDLLLSGIRDVRVETIPGTAFLPPYEKPKEFADLMIDFCGK